MKMSNAIQDKVRKLAHKHGTGKYFFYPFIFRENIQQLQSAFSVITYKLQAAYSVKANYYSPLLQQAKLKALSFDCASLFELNKVLDAGIEPGHIWISTPYLEPELLQKCLHLGVSINADSIQQLQQIEDQACQLKKTVRLGLRLNLTHLEQSRFGIEVSPASLKQLFKILDSTQWLELKTLHTHYSGAQRTAMAYADRAGALYDLYRNSFTRFPITQLNIGGGMAGPMPGSLLQQLKYTPPDWQDYAQAVKRQLPGFNESGLSLVVEPGMALVANTFSFLAEVLDIKNVSGNSMALLNASKLFLKPTGHKYNLPFEVAHCRTGEKANYQLMGITCMESDLLGTYNGELAVGDLFHFQNVGAYTLSYCPDFIFESPEVIFLDQHQ